MYVHTYVCMYVYVCVCMHASSCVEIFIVHRFK